MARFVALTKFYTVSLCLLCVQIAAVIATCDNISSNIHTYCVVPSCDVIYTSQCEARSLGPCLSYSAFIHHQDSDDLKSNKTFHFVKGTYLHNSSFNVNKFTDWTLMALDTAVIQCHNENEVGFVFENFSKITIRNMAFVNCGQPYVTHRNQSFLVALAFVNGIELVLDNVVINDSRVQGFHIYGIHNRISINESKFIRSGYRLNQTNSDIDIAGNSIFVDSDDQDSPQPNDDTLNINIKGSKFLNNSNLPDCALIGYDSDEHCTCRHLASGLALILRRSNVSVTLSELEFDGNRGCLGGNLAVVFNTTTPFVGNVSIQDCQTRNGLAADGGGMYIYYLSTPYPNDNCSLEDNSIIDVITISNTIFEGNTAVVGGGLYAGLTESLAICTPYRITIDQCSFRRNTFTREGYGGVAIHNMNFISFPYKRQILLQFLLVIQNSNFTQHTYSSDNLWNNSGSGVIYVKTNHHAEIKDILIYENMYSGIVIVDSNLVVYGTVEIYGNNGSSGGGMLFCSNSVMFLTPNTTLNIFNNHVEHAGGGICVEDQCLQSRPLCFFQLDYNGIVNPQSNSYVEVLLTENSAKYAGDQLYGGSIDYCYIIDSPFYNVTQHRGSYVNTFRHLFHYYPNNSHSVTSPQRQVCLCDGSSNSKNISYNCSRQIQAPRSVYPGEPFKLSAVVVGQLNGMVPGTVYAKLREINDPRINQKLQYGEVQKIFERTCTDLNYTIYTNHDSYTATLELSVQYVGDKSFTDHLTFYKPLEVIIPIKKCPLGFNLTHDYSRYCTCLHQIRHGFNCIRKNETIVPKRGYWIGHSPSDSNETIVYSKGCTVDYCKNTHLDFNESSVWIQSGQTGFSEVDNQCDFNRTGVLCGACPDNYSVILGSSDCRECSNTYLLLIPLFAVMGIVLVLLLMALNMTVTEGTVNGLLFYANIVQISNRIFFRGKSIRLLSRLLKGFIAWLNLDFGIEVCLYDGMDDYAKAWLQFAFPLYIWLITGIIIYLSRRYTLVARLVKRNGVKVLATLILISYAKMVRASIVAIHFKMLFHLDPNGTNSETSTMCWYSNCNIPYMEGKHIPLGILGYVSGLALLPFAFLLLCSDVLQKCKCFHCLWRLKPFIDAYTGPYTNEGRYWTGLLLVARVGLFAASSLDHTTGKTSLNVTLANTVVALLLILPWTLRSGIYQKRWLNVLEVSFMLNLGILTIGTTYLFYRNEHQDWLTHFSVGLALVTFIVIVTYHICQTKCVQMVFTWIKSRRRISFDRDTKSGDSDQTDSDEEFLRNFPPLVRFNEDREPLLRQTVTD